MPVTLSTLTPRSRVLNLTGTSGITAPWKLYAVTVSGDTTPAVSRNESPSTTEGKGRESTEKDSTAPGSDGMSVHATTAPAIAAAAETRSVARPVI